MTPRRLPLPLTVLFALAGITAALPLAAQDAPPAAEPPAAAPAPSVNYRERPHYPYDRQRLKRRPKIDGVIADGEWDALYTVGDGPVNGTVYLNWDDDNLYLAARTDRPAWTVFDIDASADGWLHGADNLELAVAPVSEGVMPPITARVLDAASGKDQPVWKDSVVDVKMIEVAAKASGNSYVVELAIPKGIAGIVPRANGTMSVRADFLPADVVPSPTAPYEPHLLLDVDLVDARVTSAPGVAPRLTLENSRVISGGTLRATLELISTSNDAAAIKAVSWKGEGAASDIVRSERDPNTPELQPGKTLKLRYSSDIADTAVPGFYQISASADLDGGRAAATTASFQVVEPFVLTMYADPESAIASDENKEKIYVDIQCAVPGYTRGNVELEVPSGWIVDGRSKKSFDSPRRDSTVRSPFFVTIPAATPTGDYVVHVTVTWNKRTWKARHIVHVEKGAAPAPPKEGEK